MTKVSTRNGRQRRDALYDLDVFKVARLYLEDHKDSVQEEDYRFLTGAIRSRRYDLLADAFRGTGPNIRGLAETKVLSQIAAFFKKDAARSDPNRCYAQALKNFERGELLCRLTNKRIDHFSLWPDRLDPDLQRVLVRMRRVIATCCGDLKTFRERIPELVKVTPGATEDTTREKSLPYLKMRRWVRCTRGAVPYVTSLTRYTTGGEPRIRITDSNRLEFVPKDFKTYRTIACEPVGNLPFQLAVDQWLKARLRRVLNIDLSDQSCNQELARKGSLNGTYATVDLAMASDTLAFNVIPYLFPEEWYNTLCSLRSRCYNHRELHGVYAKFSSMGNGFTFSVETLVFSAACVAVGSRSFKVYGDDIVIESSLYEPLVAVLSFLGFQPNEEKSFHTGPFRESCGVDYHTGVNIRPFFIKNSSKLVAPDLCHLINGLVRIAGPGLMQYLRGIVLDLGLLLVPRNEDTRSGVFVESLFARKRGLLNRHFGIDRFKAYTVLESTKYRGCLKCLLLWHVLKLSGPSVVYETSLAPTRARKLCVRKRVWFPCAEDIQLSEWTEYISRSRR